VPAYYRLSTHIRSTKTVITLRNVHTNLGFRPLFVFELGANREANRQDCNAAYNDGCVVVRRRLFSLPAAGLLCRVRSSDVTWMMRLFIEPIRW